MIEKSGFIEKKLTTKLKEVKKQLERFIVFKPLMVKLQKLDSTYLLLCPCSTKYTQDLPTVWNEFAGFLGSL